jgi:hypothetical protein
MSELSPASQSVLDAANNVYWDWSDLAPAGPSIISAAVICAVADQVVPKGDYKSGEVMLIAMNIRCKLLAIADELKNYK